MLVLVLVLVVLVFFFPGTGEIYLAAAASLIASWFYIVMFHLHRTQEEAHWSSSIELEWFSL